MRPKCAFGPCKREAHARGYCFGHYFQLRRGRPLRELHTRHRDDGKAALEGALYMLRKRLGWEGSSDVSRKAEGDER